MSKPNWNQSAEVRAFFQRIGRKGGLMCSVAHKRKAGKIGSKIRWGDKYRCPVCLRPVSETMVRNLSITPTTWNEIDQQKKQKGKQ